MGLKGFRHHRCIDFLTSSLISPSSSSLRLFESTPKHLVLLFLQPACPFQHDPNIDHLPPTCAKTEPGRQLLFRPLPPVEASVIAAREKVYDREPGVSKPVAATPIFIQSSAFLRLPLALSTDRQHVERDDRDSNQCSLRAPHGQQSWSRGHRHSVYLSHHQYLGCCRQDMDQIDYNSESGRHRFCNPRLYSK